MKVKKQYKPKPKSLPMLVNRFVNDSIEGAEELAMLHAFQYGTATRKDYDYLVRMANMLNIASQMRGAIPQESINAVNFLARLILERYQRTGKFGVNGDELSALRDVVTFYNSFWKRTSTTFYNDCIFQLNEFYAQLREKKDAA